MSQYADPVIADRARDMESVIRTYLDGCNEADSEKMTRCFVSDAVHYFPPGMYEGPFRGADVIARRWAEAVETLGSYWTVDRLLVDPVTRQAVMEWSHFKTRQGTVLRGDEWYLFDEETGLIREIRAYYASPQDATLSHLQLDGFDYSSRGYAMAPPTDARPELGVTR